MNFFIKSALLFVVLSTNVYAENTSDAKKVILRYLEAVKIYDTTIMSDLMHPEALKQFKDVFESALSGSNSDLAKSEILPVFGANTVEEFRQLDDMAAYKKFNDFAKNSRPELLELMHKSQFKVVTENIHGDIAYFTYELALNINGKVVRTEAVQKLKQHNGRWMLLLSAEAEASAAGIAARYN